MFSTDPEQLTLEQLQTLELLAIERFNGESDPFSPLAFGGNDLLLGPSDACWPEHDRDPNTKHLFMAASAGAFTFTAAHLERLVAANRFQVPDDQDRVIFGLRGCRLADGAALTGFSPEVELAEDTPDHQTPRCVLGVWRRSTAEIAVFRANTVPYWEYVARYMAGGDGANMLPTGLYRYKVGHHHEMPGALRLDEDGVIVIRPAKDKGSICFETTDLWDGPVKPYDNIHPAFDNSAPFQRTGSAGCQTVPGSWVGNRHIGHWATFREQSGVAEAAEGARYTYMLLTGREARMASIGAPDGMLSRLRFGASGPEVSALQTALGLGADGCWGPKTSRAVINWQWRHLGGWADAIVTPQRAEKMGFALR